MYDYIYSITDYLGFTEPSEFGMMFHIFDDIIVIGLHKPDSTDTWICSKKNNITKILYKKQIYNLSWRESILQANKLLSGGWFLLSREEIINIQNPN